LAKDPIARAIFVREKYCAKIDGVLSQQQSQEYYNNLVEKEIGITQKGRTFALI
jgi:hypothetical protein